MQTIIMYIENHWVIWLLGGINIALSWSYRKLTQYVSTEKKHMDAIMGGTRVLLRSQLLTQYNHYYKDLHYCPVYACISSSVFPKNRKEKFPTLGMGYSHISAGNIFI